MVHERHDSALLAFCRRQTGIERAEFLRDAQQAQAVVEALKGWLAREAKVRWSDHADPLDAVIAAQGKLLDLDSPAAPSGTVEDQAWRAWRAGELTHADKIRATQCLGAAIRARS